MPSTYIMALRGLIIQGLFMMNAIHSISEEPEYSGIGFQTVSYFSNGHRSYHLNDYRFLSALVMKLTKKDYR